MGVRANLCSFALHIINDVAFHILELLLIFKVILDTFL